ncbi:DUF2269 family protein [Hazenella coriacea]|uniref:DUF2269 family protein n=1 Tax=Hazenella coriacea TaxID=1179467 RepID=UPI001A9EC21D|nr:DUF2269 family protein [Hazenella coriacea]
MLYRITLYTHVISAILSIGPFFILFPIIKRIQKASSSEVIQAYLDSFSFTVRLAKHAGHVLVVSGILLVMNSGWTWKTPWIMMTILIMVSSLFFLARAFSPTLKKFKKPDADIDSLTQRLHRSTIIYIALLLLMLWFMVAKPSLSFFDSVF